MDTVNMDHSKKKIGLFCSSKSSYIGSNTHDAESTPKLTDSYQTKEPMTQSVITLRKFNKV